MLFCFILAIVIFIGHGSDPLSASQIPPSSEKNTGRLVFLSREAKQLHPTTALQHISNKMYDDLTDFQLTAGKTLFICQACYSGTIMDHDTSGANIACSVFPEVRITYCGNHTAKSFHRDLVKIKSVRCKVNVFVITTAMNKYYYAVPTTMQVEDQ